MKTVLTAVFGGIFVWMIVMTVRTSMTMSLWSAWGSFADNPWAVATLWDAYFGFFTFWVSRILWLIVIFALGNIAMSFYVLMQLFRLKPGEPVETLLKRA